MACSLSVAPLLADSLAGRAGARPDHPINGARQESWQRIGGVSPPRGRFSQPRRPREGSCEAFTGETTDQVLSCETRISVLLRQKSICDNQSHHARENQQCREGFSDHFARRMELSRLTG